MIGDIDYAKKVLLPQLFLCKPNRTTIAKLHESFSLKLKLKLGNVNELEFLVPYETELNHLIQENPNISLVKDRYLIRFVYGEMTEWFMIETPSINIEDEKNYKDVKCYSLAYELRDKILHGYKTFALASDGTYIDSSYNASHLLNDALSDTLWNIGYVDASFDTIYRSFSETSITSLDFILKIAETFQGILKFDTEKREVSLLSLSSVGMNRGLKFSYGHYVKMMKKEMQKEDFCTRLKVYGKSGVSINAANPTGSEYLEDFTYLLYPYQEDANGNVVQSSDHINDDLCHAILTYDKKVKSVSGQYTNLLSQLTTKQTRLTTDQNVMQNLQTQLAQLKDNLDTSNATNNVNLGTWSVTTNYVANNIVTYSGNYYMAIATNKNVIPNTLNNTVWVTSDGKSNLSVQSQIANMNTQIASQQTIIDNDNASIASIQYTITVNIGATNSNNITFAVDGRSIVVAVVAGDTTNTIATKINTAFNKSYPTFKSSVANNVVTVQYFVSSPFSKTPMTFADSGNTQVATSIASIDNGLENKISTLQLSLSLENNFTPRQIMERNQFVVEKEFNDQNVDTPQDLYNAALLAFEKFKTPHPMIAIDIVNFKEIAECQHDWDKLNLGDIVTIYYPQFDTNVEAMIIEANFNFDEDGGTSSSDSQCQITISNFKNVLTDEQRLLDLLYRSTGTSTTVDMSKYKWDATVANMSEVQQILQNTWNANERAIVAGINESVRIDNRGITITDPNDLLSYLIAQHCILAITNDGGQTWRNAITKNGIVAEHLFGQIIMGEDLTIGSNDGVLQFIGNQGIITDRNGVVVMKLGLYDTVGGIDKFGIELFGQNGHVLMDSNEGFKIVGKDGNNKLWMDANGNVHATNAYFSGVVDASAFSVNGVNFLTSDGLYLDGAHFKHVVADTIDTGTINAHLVDVRSALTGGGEIILDANGLRAFDALGNQTINIGSAGGKIVGAEIDSAPDGHARIQLKGNTFTGLTPTDLASGLKFSVDDLGSTDIGLYHQGVKMVDFHDGGSFFTLKPTTDADFLGLGATDHETRCYGKWNFYDNIITMIDGAGLEKFKIYTIPNGSGANSNPVIQMGVGTGTGDNGKVKIIKQDIGLEIDYTDTNGNVKSFKVDEDGIKLTHSVGSYIQLDNSGNVNIHATNNIGMSHGGTLNLDA